MNIRDRRAIACELSLLTLALVWHSVVAYQDRIVIKNEKGVPVVYNPKNPILVAGRPTSLFLKEDLTIGSER